MYSLLNNYQLWLRILVVISLWIVLSVELKLIPLIPSLLSETFVSNLNRVLLNISYSFLAAYIFYIITSVLPRKMLIYRLKKVSARQVHELLYELFILISLILYAFGIKKKIGKIEKKDLYCIDSCIERMNFYGFYTTSERWLDFWKKGKHFTGLNGVSYSYPGDLTKISQKILNIINRIRKNNSNFYHDSHFTEVLSAIETNTLIQNCSTQESDRPFLSADHSESLYQLISDYGKLNKLGYHKLYLNSFHTINFYGPDMLINREQETIDIINDSHISQSKVNSLVPSIIYNEDYYDGRAISSKLNDGFLIDMEKKTLSKQFQIIIWNKGKIQQPNYSRCVILIEDKIPKRQIKEYITTNKNTLIIIRLKSSLFFTSKIDKYENEKTSFGVYTVYYRRPLSLFNWGLFNEYPTKETLRYVRSNVMNIMWNFQDKHK